jgi:hypothetical protein
MNTPSTTYAQPDTTGARVRAEGPIRLDEVTHLFKADTRSGHVSLSTLLRWLIKGKRGVKLEGARIRGEWHTSYQAVQRFKKAAGV